MSEGANPEGDRRRADEFAEQAEQQSQGLLREYWEFLLHNKKWSPCFSWAC
jgi:hypothetical protein